MALFFDQSWFDSRLTALGLTQAEIALALGLTTSEVDEIWKDQRELSARDVMTLAQLLAASPHEIATHAGVSTPVPSSAHASEARILKRLDAIDRRLDTIGQELSVLRMLIEKA